MCQNSPPPLISLVYYLHLKILHPIKFWTIFSLILCFIFSLVNLIIYWTEDVNRCGYRFGSVFIGLSIVQMILVLPAIYLIVRKLTTYWDVPLLIHYRPDVADISTEALAAAPPTVRSSAQPSAQPSAPTLSVSDENSPPPSYDSVVKTIWV